MSEKDLMEAAFKVRGHAHAPYTKFSVGAAVLTRSGKIFTGCNIENVSLGLTICAERAAVAAAVAHGEKELIVMAIVADSSEPVVPCGACRQVMAEFNPAMKIVASTGDGHMQEFNLGDLLPRARQGILESFRNV
jgi:cytidine deaminase